MNPNDPGPDRLLEHDYDGIQEYDNPLPRWWLYLFYATIVFSVLYLINLPGIGTGKGRIANYEREMAAARARFRTAAAAAPTVTEAELVALSHDPSRLAAGKTEFTTVCAACHRPDGGGNIGPNLTDDFWIHGGKPLEILHTVTVGVPDKGMPAWGQVLKPELVASVAAYVLTLHDTHPQNPKPPQGVKMTDEAAETRAP